MARQIIINIPEDGDPSEHDSYVREVADQLGQGYLSGHVDPQTHWSIYLTTEKDA